VPRKKRVRKKHVPQRTCVGCREVLAKRSLIRVVRQAEGIIIDPTGKQPGRGAYIHNRRSCWELALKGSLALALKIALTDHDRDNLSAFMATLPDESPAKSDE
jgi:uncharacterized protein